MSFETSNKTEADGVGRGNARWHARLIATAVLFLLAVLGLSFNPTGTLRLAKWAAASGAERGTETPTLGHRESLRAVLSAERKDLPKAADGAAAAALVCTVAAFMPHGDPAMDAARPSVRFMPAAPAVCRARGPPAMAG